MIDLILKGSGQLINYLEAINMAVQSHDCTAGFVIYEDICVSSQREI